jgi:putative (di)nucleoside polyphosphate hydrolase
MTLPLRPNVCLLVLSSTQQLLIGERCGEPGEWQFPQGGIKSGQSIQEAALEEAHEELGVSPELFSFQGILNYRNDYEWIVTPNCYTNVYRGQSQQFVILKFLGMDSDIRLDYCLHNPLMIQRGCTQEFSSWKWIERADVKASVMGVRVPGYEGALLELENLLRI